jgi:acetolactate synthase-1/2/3 large subunit
MDALHGSSVRFVGCRTELAAAFAADGFARGRARVPVVIASTGPGALISLAGLQEARESCAPMVVIVTDVNRSAGRRQMSQLHELPDQLGVLAGVAKSAREVTHVSEIPSAVSEAVREARRAPAGPVVLQVPADTLASVDANHAVAAADARAPETVPEAALDGLLEALERSSRPTVVVGGGVNASHGGRDVVSIAETLGAPMVSTFAGKGSVPWTHPLHVGSWLEAPATRELLEASDLVLALGCGLGELTTTNFALRPRGHVAQIDVDLQRLWTGNETTGICARLEDALPYIRAALPARDEQRRGAGAAEAARARAAIHAWEATRGTVEASLLRDIRETLPASGTSAWDMTILGYWAWNAFPVEPEGRFLSAQGAGGLGYAIPAAIGAAVAQPGAEVLAVCGDGGFPYVAAELATAAEVGVSIACLVIDDGGYGVLAHYQDERFGRHTAVRLTGPDVVELANAHGVPARRTTLQEIRTDLRWALANPSPSVVVLQHALEMF